MIQREFHMNKSMIPPFGFLVFVGYVLVLTHVVAAGIIYLMADF